MWNYLSSYQNHPSQARNQCQLEKNPKDLAFFFSFYILHTKSMDLPDI